MLTHKIWASWYPRLLPRGDDTPALVADVHTNYADDASFPALQTPGVLHVATGDVAAVLLIIEDGAEATMYVGPAYSHFEHLEAQAPPRCLPDEEWREWLRGQERPPVPGWARSFRIGATERQHLRPLPDATRERS